LHPEAGKGPPTISLTFGPRRALFAAARTRLKKMKADEEAKKLADAAKGPSERSPHVKEVRGRPRMLLVTMPHVL
jgi:hypothetical protein